MARHCIACGTAMDPADDGPHPRHRCPSCGRTDYHNPAPAVGAAILRGPEVLLSRRARGPQVDQWDMVGGFVEAHESARDALAREVLEETGLTLRDAELVDVLPGEYAGRPTLNLLFIARADGEPEARDDSAELRWFPLDALPDDLAWPHEADMLRRLAAMADALMAGADPAAP